MDAPAVRDVPTGDVEDVSSKSKAKVQGHELLIMLRNPRFQLGALVGFLIGITACYVPMSMKVEKVKVQMLLMKMEHQRVATAGGTTLADALLPTPCADGELSPLSAAKEEEYTKRIRELELDQKQSQFTIDEYARQCMQKGNLTVQLDQVSVAERARCEQETRQLRVDLDSMRAEKAIWTREKEELNAEIKSNVAQTLQTHKMRMGMELENHKRELDIAHHTEVANHLTRAEAAERSLALANQDRDQALQDVRVLEDEKASLTQQLREMRAGKDTEMSKITGELEALSGAVMECQRTASQHDSMMCQLCSHCPAQNFPVCNRCQHIQRPTLGVPEHKKIKGKRMFY